MKIFLQIPNILQITVVIAIFVYTLSLKIKLKINPEETKTSYNETKKRINKIKVYSM